VAIVDVLPFPREHDIDVTDACPDGRMGRFRLVYVFFLLCTLLLWFRRTAHPFFAPLTLLFTYVWMEQLYFFFLLQHFLFPIRFSF